MAESVQEVIKKYQHSQEDSEAWKQDGISEATEDDWSIFSTASQLEDVHVAEDAPPTVQEATSAVWSAICWGPMWNPRWENFD